MRETKVSLPELGLVAMTRIILGVGIGLLISRRMDDRESKSVGLALTVVGALSTIPIALEIFGGNRLSEEKPSDEASAA